ncbi:hypothetical protein CERSUDRAFT_126750 [Gelatoporia subvermispora B]|uniref:adenosine kinase n=1 Tax=Ceriporiopsis subvermispora (strain B) TaxID=914234 RepID=M2Q749_CERS8|nr:hypothetical protein CERSUDRAFT_126750 [Gelatoporia subvermispora B]
MSSTRISGAAHKKLAQNELEASSKVRNHSGVQLVIFSPTTVPYHITVVTKDELRALPNQARVRAEAEHADTQHILALGLGGYPKSNVFFVVIVWAAGQVLRKRLGLPPKHFHITLSAADQHDVPKGLGALLPSEPVLPETPNPALLDHLALTLQLFGEYTRAGEVAAALCAAAPTSERGFLRLGDAARKAGTPKRAMLAFAAAYARCEDAQAREYCVRHIVEATLETEWGAVFAEAECAELPDEALEALLAPWSSELRVRLAETGTSPPTLRVPSGEARYVPFPDPEARDAGGMYRLPRFFRWLVPFQFALMSTPRNGMDIRALASPHVGIRHVVTLTEETPLDASWFVGTGVRHTFLPVPNYCPPSIEQVDLIFRLMQDEGNLPLLVHCGGGKGRAGTVAACYLAAFGFAPPRFDLVQPTMSSNDAISSLRAIRPGSIETEQQEAFVSKYCSAIWKRRSVLLDVVQEPAPCSLQVDGSLDPGCDLIVLVGLPGSGKSWLSRALITRDPRGWTYISQDESGSRAACERAIGRAPAHGRMVFDRCNASRTERREWLSLAHWAKAPVCVWFDYDEQLCTSRAQNRAGHPTLPPGGRVRSAVAQMHGMFVRPTVDEGFKAIAVVRSFAAAAELVSWLSPPVTLFKFPRTAHLLNLGSATEDDLVGGLPAVASGARVVITEKIVVQNRSHYVSPASHAQFKKLGAWLERHREELCEVLNRDPHFAQRYVLFGEWLVATHSIPYSRLPDFFLAFDMYDRSTQTWAGRRALEGILAGTSIVPVPVIYEGKMPLDTELCNMTQRPSQYYDGPLEGIYVKIEEGNRVIARGKVVRGDFISGNEHWGKAPLQLNTHFQWNRKALLQPPNHSLLPHDHRTFSVHLVAMAAHTYPLFCMGNPLLDMQVYNGEELLTKYDLKANDAILAEEKHAPIYEELVQKYKVTYVAGGAAQNAARGAAYVLPPKSVVYAGCVGDDELAEQLKAANAREGLDQAYLVKKGEKTGACAVVITGHHRCLVTTLRAAEKFEKSHLSSPEVAPLVDGARVFYVEGFFLTHGTESALEIAKKSSEAGKVFALNLSAPFIPQFFAVQLQQILPYCDIVIGNEAEAEAWASATGHPDKTNLAAVARSIATQPKSNPSRPRIVIITHGPKSTTLVSSADPDSPKVYDVHPLKDEEIVDTNGAGDAFAGGFLGAYVLGKSIDECVEAGHKLGAICVQQIGPQFKWPKVNVL